MDEAQPVAGVPRLLTRGARVWQSSYGCGTVSDLDRTHVRIEFDHHGSRLFARSIVKLFPVRVQMPDDKKPPVAGRPSRRR